jgi:transposase
MRKLTLTQKEQSRLQTLNLVFEGGMGVLEAAGILGISGHQAWRIMSAYRRDGVAALAHGNRGCRPANAISEETRQCVIELAGTRYAGLNHTHLTELLAEREKITLSRSTVRNILVGVGIVSPRQRRPPQHRCRRERMPQEGVLVQIDGSYHNWLESRGPWLTMTLQGPFHGHCSANAKMPRGISDCFGELPSFEACRWQCTRTGILYFSRHTALMRLWKNLCPKGEGTLAQNMWERLSQLPPLRIEDGPYCRLIREARDVFVDGHYYSCVAMCGISFERFQRDRAAPYGAIREHKMWQTCETTTRMGKG